MIFHPVLPSLDFFTLKLISLFNIITGDSNFSIFSDFSVTFSLAALKLLAFLSDLLKLLILLRIGSGRTFVSSGESEGTYE